MEDKTEKASGALQLICPTCGAKYTLPKYVEGQRYGCKRCSASLMFGKFALLQELGRGGFGVVYKAFQADLERVVALKFLHSDSPESTERFMREARIAANLSHPNITAIYEVGQHEGKPYITMQYVDGITTNKASFSVREAVFVMRDAAIAVDYAHARDIIHRDIKPHNIMVMEDRSGMSIQGGTRRTFVMDFGLARSANKGGTLTTEGQVMGTPAFMSPEQAEGKSCDVRSDVYSLGATLFSLVTKRPPFEAPTPLQILMQVTQEEPPAPSTINPEVDKGLEAIILKAMAKDPAHRYPTAARFAQDLTSWLAGGVTDAGPTVHLSLTPGALKAQARRKKSGTMIGLGLVLMLAGGGGLAWRTLSKKQEGAVSVGSGATLDPLPPKGASPNPSEPPRPTIVLLEVSTDPPGAALRINNKEWKTPVSLDDSQIAPGTYDIEIIKSGFETIPERVTVTAGPKAVTLYKKLQQETRKVAFVLESDPPGAKIILNEFGTGLTTPHPIYVDQFRTPAANVVLELEGFRPETRTCVPSEEPYRIKLTPKTGLFVVSGAVSGATVHLFAVPGPIKNIRAVTGLWSENPDALEQAVAALDGADVPHVVDRLKALAAHPEVRPHDRLVKLAAVPPSSTQIRPERTDTADGRGGARLIDAWVMNRYCIFATSSRTLDFVSSDLILKQGDEISVPVEMAVLVTLSAKAVHPAVGKFRIEHADPRPVADLLPGGAPVRLAAGPVTLHYKPPPNDPILRAFTIMLDLKGSYELAGHLLQYCAEAYAKEGDTAKAMRAYTLLLKEKPVLASEQGERAKLIDAVRGYYRAWVDGVEKQGQTAGIDLAPKIEAERKKPPVEAIPALLEIYAAKDAGVAVRGSAATGLAYAHAKLMRPYEAIEWSERLAKLKIDPGQETIGAVAAAIQGYPGLEERWDAVTAAIEDVRKAAETAVKPEVPAPPPPPPAGKIGVLQSVSGLGIYVKLELDVLGQLSKGDLLYVFREGKLIGEIIIDNKSGPESKYPFGSLKCDRGHGSIQRGDEVRNKK
jgi:serine/threonine protein kinase